MLTLLALLPARLWAAPLPPATPSRASALRPDATLKPGASGSFDARGYDFFTAPDGHPVGSGSTVLPLPTGLVARVYIRRCGTQAQRLTVE